MEGDGGLFFGGLAEGAAELLVAAGDEGEEGFAKEALGFGEKFRNGAVFEEAGEDDHRAGEAGGGHLGLGGGDQGGAGGFDAGGNGAGDVAQGGGQASFKEVFAGDVGIAEVAEGLAEARRQAATALAVGLSEKGAKGGRIRPDGARRRGGRE